ncbi:glyoxalase/bleomycin resistance/extradiol dioxygenase family protein [Actinotalea sp. Marseille-Q4924]|uniref:VOC family protein n=1 Tax=Actinotalea sp. Marseille-Q4924 TaxID=2866571 RepID=UPI001CE3D6FE|nr:VOC family protein [Actinotalea sp. Marseille-Q4924]
MSSGEVFPILHVDAIEPVLAFYRDTFAAEVSYRFPDDGVPEYLTLRIGRSSVALALGTSPTMYGEVPLPASGHAVDLCIYVPDLDAAVVAAPRARGEVTVPPTDTPWGERVAYLRDPQGTMLLVIQDDGEAHRGEVGEG